MKNEIRHATRALLNLSEGKRQVGRAKAYKEAAADLLSFWDRYDRMTRTQKLERLKRMAATWTRRADQAELRGERYLRPGRGGR